jgi:hypothetical protein
MESQFASYRCNLALLQARNQMKHHQNEQDEQQQAESAAHVAILRLRASESKTAGKQNQHHKNNYDHEAPLLIEMPKRKGRNPVKDIPPQHLRQTARMLLIKCTPKRKPPCERGAVEWMRGAQSRRVSSQAR